MIINAGVVMALIAVLGVGPAQPSTGPLPGLSGTIVANMAGRPIQFSSYLGPYEGAPGAKAWVWDPGKRAFVTAGNSVTVSPDERWQATLIAQDPDIVPQVRFLDRKTGVANTVSLPVPADPSRPQHLLGAGWPVWSPDSRHLLLSVGKSGDAPRSEGIVLVEVPSLKPRFVRIEDALITIGGFVWTRDGKGVVVRWGKNGQSSVRQYDLNGAVKRTWHVRGRPVEQGQGTFSPSGRRFVTACMSLESFACVWDTATGKAVTRVKLASGPVEGTLLGWYDEHHLLAPTPQGVGIVNLRGTVTETLIKVGRDQGFFPRFDARGKG